jgi:hypothetical protein
MWMNFYVDTNVWWKWIQNDNCVYNYDNEDIGMTMKISEWQWIYRNDNENIRMIMKISEWQWIYQNDNDDIRMVIKISEW